MASLYDEYHKRKQQRELDSGKVDKEESRYIDLMSDRNLFVIIDHYDFLGQTPHSRSDN